MAWGGVNRFFLSFFRNWEEPGFTGAVADGVPGAVEVGATAAGGGVIVDAADGVAARMGESGFMVVFYFGLGA